jgi:hypothetical protein
MPSLCGVCGKPHEGIPQFFMWKRPECAVDSSAEFLEDSKSMARTGASQFFVSCEVDVPLASDRRRVLGFICWVEVSQSDYATLLAYRKSEDTATPYESLVEGRLANPVPCVAGSLGMDVKFQVLKGDPTPYIKWVAPDSAVARLIDTGASQDYWHEAAVRMGWREGA